MLNVIDHIPTALLSAKTTELNALLGGPTLIHLRGRREPPLFVAVLLHGNEDTGFYAIQEILREYRDQELPRALSLFIGNVAAAEHGQRRLDHQPDYNRVWPGTDDNSSPEAGIMQQIYHQMRQRGVFASIDVHNNTGLNPHYACLNRLDDPVLHLASLFSRTAVYFLRPKGVQSLAFAELCPAVTIECGKVGVEHGSAHAREYLTACLHLAQHPQHAIAPQDIDLFHTVATVKVRPGTGFSFGEAGSALCFIDDLDHLNFRELPSGTLLARQAADDVHVLEVIDEAGRLVTEQFFASRDGAIRTTRPVMPSMLTMNAQAIRQDCLCYLMERLTLQSSAAAIQARGS